MSNIKVIRGAVCAQNTAESISANAVELVKQIMQSNSLSPRQISAVFFSTTEDLDACYPATEVRKQLLPSAAFMCFAEMKVQGSLPQCIRVAVFAETDKEAKHCYLGEAATLRPDLA